MNQINGNGNRLEIFIAIIKFLPLTEPGNLRLFFFFFLMLWVSGDGLLNLKIIYTETQFKKTKKSN